jgi:hypothetical protein
LTTLATGGEVDFRAQNEVNMSSVRASFLTASLVIKCGQEAKLDVLLPTLGSDATFVKALAYLEHYYRRTGFFKASAYLNISLVALESRKLR